MTRSVAAVLADSAERRPSHPALVCGAERISYAHLWDRARRYAAALRGQGIGPDDKVALLLPNTPEFAALYFAVLALGAVVVPVHTLLKPAEVSHLLRDSGARALVWAGTLPEETARDAEAAGALLLTVGRPPTVPSSSTSAPSPSTRTPSGGRTTWRWSSTPPVRRAGRRGRCSRTATSRRTSP